MLRASFTEGEKARPDPVGSSLASLLELIIAIALVALNGVFALSELAIVSARRPRLKAMAEQGRSGAKPP